MFRVCLVKKVKKQSIFPSLWNNLCLCVLETSSGSLTGHFILLIFIVSFLLHYAIFKNTFKYWNWVSFPPLSHLWTATANACRGPRVLSEVQHSSSLAKGQGTLACFLEFSDLCCLSDLDIYLGLSPGFGLEESEQIDFPFFIIRSNWPVPRTYTVSISTNALFVLWRSWRIVCLVENTQALGISYLDIVLLLLLVSVASSGRSLYCPVPQSPHL